MGRSARTGGVALLAGLATVMVSIGAQAQSAAVAPRVELAPMQPSAYGAVFVQLRAGAREYSITPAGGSRHAPSPVIASCAGDCAFWVWPGSYKLHFPASGEEGAKTLGLRVQAPGTYTLVPADVAARNAGLTLGIAGSAIAGVGFVLFIAGLLSTSCDDDSKGNGTCERSPVLYYGLGTLAVGGAIGTLGWVMYGTNRAHFAYRAPQTAATAPLLTARVGLVPLPRGGFGLGAALAF